MVYSFHVEEFPRKQQQFPAPFISRCGQVTSLMKCKRWWEPFPGWGWWASPHSFVLSFDQMQDGEAIGWKEPGFLNNWMEESHPPTRNVNLRLLCEQEVYFYCVEPLYIWGSFCYRRLHYPNSHNFYVKSVSLLHQSRHVFVALLPTVKRALDVGTQRKCLSAKNQPFL